MKRSEYGIFRGLINKVHHIGKPLLSKEFPFHEYQQTVFSFSQNAEDLLVDAILECPKTGTYVDVGANDPVDSNNTFRFYRKGWTGICIEPCPEKYRALCLHRPKDIILDCGVSDKFGHKTLTIFDKDGVSTFNQELINYTNLTFDTKVVRQIPVFMHRLETIFDKFLDNRKIDFMSVDVEGGEVGVLNSNNWEKYRPKVIVIEFAYNTDEIYNILQKQGYLPVLRTSANTIFVRND